MTSTLVHALPELATEKVSAEVMVGAVPMVSVSVCVAVPFTSLAERLMVALPVAVGVPLMTPVDGLNVAHAGRLVAASVMGAVPLAVTVYENGLPTAALAVAGLVMSVGILAKVPVTVCVSAVVNVQAPVPLQVPPVHPVNIEPAAGTALMVTCVPEAKLPLTVEQPAPHDRPAGVAMSSPAPAP